jgi:hypothetical protein
MFPRSVNDNSRVVRMTIIGDATTFSVTDDSRDVIYDRSIFITRATDLIVFFFFSPSGFDRNFFIVSCLLGDSAIGAELIQCRKRSFATFGR